MDEAARFLDTIYQGQRGWRELCYIIGDPDDRVNSTFHQEWYVLAQHDKMLARIAELQALGYNVYVGASTYSKRQRAKEYALPSQAIVIDDAPAGEYSFTVQTGPSSRHAWILTPHRLEPNDRERIARNAAYATGGDTGGWDCTQLVRVPGGLNTKAKYGEPYRVHIVPGSGKTYHLDELEARWPAAPERINAEAITLDDPAVERELARVDKIMRRIPTTALTYKRLMGQVFCKNRNGEKSRTDTRWALSCDLRSRYRLPDAEIAALLIAHDWGTLNDKGSAWLYADIARCIGAAHTKHPDVTPEPTHGGQAITPRALPSVARASRARKDRPQRVTLDDYRTWLRSQAIGGTTVMMTRKEIAAALGISVATVDRFERILRECGEIERKTHRKRGGTYSYVVVFSAINIAQEPAATAETTADLVLSDAHTQNTEIAHQDAVNVEIAKSPIEVTHRPDSSSLVTRPVVRAAPETIADAISAACDVKGADSKAAWRYFSRTFPHLVAKLAPNFVIARGKFMERYESELAFRECSPDHAGALDTVHLGQLRASRRLQQPTLLDVTGVRDIGINLPHNGEPSRACVSSLPHAHGQSHVETQQVQAEAPASSDAPAAPIRMIRDPRTIRERAELVRAIQQLSPQSTMDYARASVFDLRCMKHALEAQGAPA